MDKVYHAQPTPPSPPTSTKSRPIWRKQRQAVISDHRKWDSNSIRSRSKANPSRHMHRNTAVPSHHAIPVHVHVGVSFSLSLCVLCHHPPPPKQPNAHGKADATCGSVEYLMAAEANLITSLLLPSSETGWVMSSLLMMRGGVTLQDVGGKYQHRKRGSVSFHVTSVS